MKKIIVSLVGFLSVTAVVNAQDLYVDDASYVYVQDEVVFVTNDLRLENGSDAIGTGSHIYLRDGAQLVQANNVKNSQDGKLSVYQTPTHNLYGYNYWCSPVGLGADSNVNADSEFEVANLYKPASIALNETDSSVYGTTAAYDATASEIATYWLWKVKDANSYSDWVEVKDINTVPAGEGFTMKGRLGLGTAVLDEQLDFRGRPNTGTFTLPLNENNTQVAQANYDGLADYQVQTLTGNPFPSTMDLKLLFYIPNATMTAMPVRTDNEEISEVWFWEENNGTSHYLDQYNGGYSSYIPGSNNATDDGTFAAATFLGYDQTGSSTGTAGTSGTYARERRFAAIGQGFMLVTDAATHNVIVPNAGTVDNLVTIDNSMRLYVKDNVGGSAVVQVFAKNTQNDQPPIGNQEIVAMSHNGIDYMQVMNNPMLVPEMRIHTKVNDTYYRETVLAFRDNTNTDVYNKFCDGNTPVLNSSDVYFSTENRKLNIKSIAYDIDARMPFGFKAGENGLNTYELTIFSHENLPSNIEVFMYDKELDTYTDILNGTFSLTLDQGVYNDRFEITFKESIAVVDVIEEEIAGSFTVFQNNSAGSLMIKNPESHDVKSFTMFDITGKMIYNEANLGAKTDYSFPTTSLSTGTYLVKVITKNQVEITKKVIVHNN